MLRRAAFAATRHAWPAAARARASALATAGAAAAAACASSALRRDLDDGELDFLARICAAPSPVGLEASMTQGVIRPELAPLVPPTWAFHSLVGSAGLVLDTAPDASSLARSKRPLTVMVVGHADKIRMQVRSIDASGKVYVNSDSMLPLSLLGAPVALYSEDRAAPTRYRVLRGGTVEALGAIHFAPSALETGGKGVKADQLYIELHAHGAARKAQVEALGIRVGDTILLDRPLVRGPWPSTIRAPYLDNALGCFVVAQAAKRVAACATAAATATLSATELASTSRASNGVRVLFAWAAWEEIGRFGAAVLASTLRPEVLLAVDVSHDYTSAPGIGDQRMPPVAMGEGISVVVGAVASETLGTVLQQVAHKHSLPTLQRIARGEDTGTDAMGAVFGGLDAAAGSLGVPVRHMHTISEAAHTGDVAVAIEMVTRTIAELALLDGGREHFTHSHPRLDKATPLVVSETKP